MDKHMRDMARRATQGDPEAAAQLAAAVRRTLPGTLTIASPVEERGGFTALRYERVLGSSDGLRRNVFVDVYGLANERRRQTVREPGRTPRRVMASVGVRGWYVEGYAELPFPKDYTLIYIPHGPAGGDSGRVFSDVNTAIEWAIHAIAELEARVSAATEPRTNPARRQSRNPFLAKPEKFHGRPAGGTHQLPGFHTASDRDQALPYAHQKGGSMDADGPREDCKECDDGRCPACLSRWRINDYPVIVAVDMSGIEPEHDVDARYVLENLMGIAREALRSDDPIDYFQGDGCVESETPGSVEVALFQSMARHEEDPAGQFGSFLEDMPEDEVLGVIRSVAAGGREASRIVMRMIGQFRYLQDVPSDRIISVDYVKPIWDELLDFQGKEEDEEKAVALEANGWDVLDLDDVYSNSVHGDYERVLERLAPPDARIEWHGTCYRNLLLAAPELVDRLPVPPLPYEERP